MTRNESLSQWKQGDKSFINSIGESQQEGQLGISLEKRMSSVLAPKKKLEQIIKQVNESLGIKAAVSMDSSTKVREGSPPKQKEAIAMKENPVVTKMLKNKEIMKTHNESWLEAIKVFKMDQQIEEMDLIDMHEYISAIKKNDKINQENFLDPKEISGLKLEMNQKSEFIMKLKGKNYKIWKPSRFNISRDIRGMIAKF